ncbi:helix-turn-helix domain-containing protein [Alcaligenes sp. SDU_A2]|uniref:helix-turn-helix domain-containing protein n=1 Tax=Alcaligenes sp. SDU_A2 TaxID=3136634 RepID=UPI002CF1F984|nr:helix-turn-helix transcriptional regulator [Alcaligenes sp.]HRL26794.1 helix-turn-helix transcriptional regulator [Alcaligenes sp.]
MMQTIISPNTQTYRVFRELIVDARHAAHLRQSDLAYKLGKPQSYVSKYERGERRLDFIEFLNIATALNLDIQQFLVIYSQKIAQDRLPK